MTTSGSSSSHDNGQVSNHLNAKSLVNELAVEAVIMAGGRGSRLTPLTDTLPKPLVKVGGTPIIERNINQLQQAGIRQFFLCVHYLAHQIEEYLGDGKQKGVSIEYVKEHKPLGTIGALALVDSFQEDSLLVMNADLLTNMDFGEFFQEFEAQEADMAVATVPYTVSIPFGVMQTNDQQEVIGLHEKPNYTYYVNAGIYLLKRDLLSLIPQRERFDATDLVQAAIQAGKKVISLPILNYWLDVGKPEDLERAQQDVKRLRLS